MANPDTIISEAETEKQRVQSKLRVAAEWFHANEGEIFERKKVIIYLSNELDVTHRVASKIISQLVGDKVDPVILVNTEDESYVGVIEYHEHDIWYGYTDYDDLLGERNVVVCAQCVNEKNKDDEVFAARSGEGSFNDGTHHTFSTLGKGVREHFEEYHDEKPDEVNTGAILSSGTTIGGNTSWHAGNDGSGSGLDSDTVDGYEATELSRPRNALSATSTDTSTDINQTSWTKISWNSQNFADAGYTHDPTNSPTDITFDDAGTYRVHAMLSYNTGNFRVNPGIKFAINGTRRDAIGLSGYVRDASGHSEGSNYLEEVIDVSAGDTLTVQTYEYGNSGTVTLRSSESVLHIEQISETVPRSEDADTVDGFHAADLVSVSGDTMTGILNVEAASGQVRLFETDAPDPNDNWTLSKNNDSFILTHYDDSASSWTDTLTAEPDGNVAFSGDIFDSGDGGYTRLRFNSGSTVIRAPQTGSGKVNLYDATNGQNILRAIEGGNVEVPNGNISANRADVDRVQFSNIEDVSDGQIGRDNSIGILASWGSNGTAPLWDAYNVNEGNQISISGGKGAESAPSIAVNDGAGSGLDADTVDGSHASNFVQTEQNSHSFDGTAGWYRIAKNGPVADGQSGGNRAQALFIVQDIQGGEHSHIAFRASVAYGSEPSITVLGSSFFGGEGLVDRIRLVSGDTYEGAAVEVYLQGSSGNVDYNIYQNVWVDGWTAVDWNAGSVPTGFSTTEVDMTKGYILGGTQGKGNSDSFRVDTNGDVYSGGSKLGGASASGISTVTGSRSLGTWYQNTDGSPRVLYVWVDRSYDIHVNTSQSNNIAHSDNDTGTSTVIVPDTHYYKIETLNNSAATFKLSEQSL